MAAGDNNTDSKGIRQIPIVCPGHTRPLAELQFLHLAPEQRTFLISACHGMFSKQTLSIAEIVVMNSFVLSHCS
jgi:hypothetical protein